MDGLTAKQSDYSWLGNEPQSAKLGLISAWEFNSGSLLLWFVCHRSGDDLVYLLRFMVFP